MYINQVSTSSSLFQVAKENPIRFLGDCAWFLGDERRYIENIDSESSGIWRGWGERVKHDTTLPTESGGSRILRAGGAVLQKSDESIVAIQPLFFTDNFSRCFSSGTIIVSLDKNPKTQAEALAQANTQLRTRHAELLDVPFWRAIKERQKIKLEKEKLLLWDGEIEQHIRELRSHTLTHKTAY